MVADHLSRLTIENEEKREISDTFPDEEILSILETPWYADIVNYLVTEHIPNHWSKDKNERFKSKLKFYFWDEPHLFKYCPDQIIRKCVPNW